MILLGKHCEELAKNCIEDQVFFSSLFKYYYLPDKHELLYAIFDVSIVLKY